MRYMIMCHSVWVDRGTWHCMGTETDGVAVVVEVVHGSVRGTGPIIFRKVASSHSSGRSQRRVSRNVSWGSVSSVLQVWTTWGVQPVSTSR